MSSVPMISGLMLALLLGLTVASAILWAVCLKLGLQWVRVPATNRGVAAATALLLGLQMAGYAALQSAPPEPFYREKVALLFEVLAGLLLPVAVIMILFRTKPSQALLAYLWTLASTVSALVFVLAVLRPFVMEAFSVPTNSMAPTILGRHVTAACSVCGGPCYSSPPDKWMRAESTPLICEKFHVTLHDDVPEKIAAGDRVLVSKFVKPRRWDLVVFRLPADPNVMYVKRLAGLPGEKVYVDDGSLWINDERVEPPPELAGLTYLSELPDDRDPLNGTRSRPAVLNDDEYFLLGDFSIRAYDSRMWHENSSGRSPYAVPESHLAGVVATTYWPPSRWRSFR